MSHFLIAFMLNPLSAAATHAQEISIPPIGKHIPVLIFEKNQNPQNIMVIYTRLKENCEFETEDKKPVFDFYWLMGGKKYKPVHRLIKSGIRKRLEVEIQSPNQFLVHFTDLKALKNSPKNSDIEIRSLKGDACQVDAIFKENGMKLTNLYSEAKKTLIPPFRKVISVTLKGRDPKTKQPLSITYH